MTRDGHHALLYMAQNSTIRYGLGGGTGKSPIEDLAIMLEEAGSYIVPRPVVFEGLPKHWGITGIWEPLTACVYDEREKSEKKGKAESLGGLGYFHGGRPFSKNL